jgi:hypothetical protein
MKKIILAAAVLLGCISIQKAEAQVSVSLGVNIGSQPAWGPVGYDYANYYYMPDIDTYYDVPTHQYVYYDNNVWVHRAYLPARYRNYDVYGGYKVVINERNPWVRNNIYRTRYAGYRGRHDQVIIRNSRDVRYANYWRGGHSYGNPRYANRTAYYNHSRGNYRPGNRYGNRDQHFGGRGNPGRGNHGHGGPGRGNQGHGNPGHGGEHHGGGHDRH